MEALLHEKIWLDQKKYESAESVLVQNSSPSTQDITSPVKSPISASFAEIASVIDSSLKSSGSPSVVRSSINMATSGGEDKTRISSLESENQDLRNELQCLSERVAKLEAYCFSQQKKGEPPVMEKPKPKVEDDDDDDDDIDLFGSDDEADEAAEKLKQERIAAYKDKKAKKPGPVAKSNLILDVKPWDDETDMKEIETCVRSIEADGLLWGSSKLVPLAYGIKKLQISCVVEDDKVGTDFLEEKITAFEDLIQSMDVAAFNKV